MKIDPRIESTVPMDSDAGHSESDIEHEVKPVPKHGALVSKPMKKEMEGTVMAIAKTTQMMMRMTPDRLQAMRAFRQEPARGSR
jgi:hypothetical protein